MFTVEERDRVREWVLNLARSDTRVTAGAMIGSMAGGAADQWSDIDITFGIALGHSPDAVLDEWTAAIDREFGMLDTFDLRAGSSLYRVFILPSGLEIDVSVTPQPDFGARGPHFEILFGSARPPEIAPPPDAHHLIGMGWHHVLHARVAIERQKPWRAEYWISALRDHTLALACLRHGENAVQARGIDRLPASLAAPLVGALVRSLDAPELRRALAVATTSLIAEVQAHDPALCARLTPLLHEYGAPDAVPANESA
ncbi:MAG TPA: hypothetical protein VM536_07390 [Chloroflexia bacterium]|nr:hypothetical protein [Chloroflexia bacterium]